MLPVRAAVLPHRPAWTLISCLVQPHGCNPEAKSSGADPRQRSTGSEGNDEKQEESLCGDILFIDFRGDLAGRRSPGRETGTHALTRRSPG
jgi:hypothetical protein